MTKPLTNADLQQKIEKLTQENELLKRTVSEKEKEIEGCIRLSAAGESAALVVHEALNPITAIISRLQHALDEESDLQLMVHILEEWFSDFEKGGIGQLSKALQEPLENGLSLADEDFGNILKGATKNNNDIEFSIKQLKRVVLILNSLRGLARFESTVEVHDVSDSVKMTKELMELSLQKSNIDIGLELNHRSTVLLDENEFVQVLHNLVRNAKQAIEKDGAITIKTSETSDFLEVRISDTGPGVPLEYVEKIFEKRFTTKDQKNGTGLGLGFCKQIMQKYKGDLELEPPQEGKGATFVCTLPLPSPSN